MERFQILKPVFSASLPQRLRKATALTATLRQNGKETTEQLQQMMQHAGTHIGYAAQDTALVLMRTGLHVANDLQRFFLADISVYSCLQYAASLLKQAAALLKK
jgi:hypothetical protein